MAQVTVGGFPLAPSHNIGDDLIPFKKYDTIKDALARDFGIGSTKAETKAKMSVQNLNNRLEAVFGKYKDGGDGSQPTAEQKMIDRSFALIHGSAPLRGLQRDAMAAASNPWNRINAAIGRGTTDVQAGFQALGRPRTPAEAMEAATGRAKALTRVSIAGKEAIEQQSLKDRIAQSMFLRQNAGAAVAGNQVGTDMGARAQQAALDAQSMRRAGMMNLAGSAAGAVANVAGNWWQNRSSQQLQPIPVTAQRVPYPTGTTSSYVHPMNYPGQGSTPR